MTVTEIRLPGGVWHYDSSQRLGPPGGFGDVFVGVDPKGRQVAVKRLKIDAAEAAHRELTIARDLSGRDMKHVMPVFDAGQDASSDRYFIVMPVAEYSLQGYLDKKGPLPASEATTILRQISEGLLEVQHLVHRDLKPGNVLLHDSRWKIADFGIARFVEDSTSVRTLKKFLTYTYAAPEQWRFEHATERTDVYALGCIAHVLLTGRTPFIGTVEDIQNGHLHGTPPPIPGVDAKVQTLVSMMLRKSSEARPSLARVKAVLEQISADSSSVGGDSPLGRLAAVAAEHERMQSAEEAERARSQSAAAKRQILVADAQTMLQEVANELRARVAASVPNAVISENSGSLKIRVASATLEVETNVRGYSDNAFPRSKWDVVCGSAIGVEQSNPHHRRSASLWYTRRNFRDAEYRWYEVGYESNPFYSKRFEFQPVALEPDLADRAHWNAIDVVQEAYPPVPIDGEDIDAFCNRWLKIFASAGDHKMQHLTTNLP